MKEFVEQTPTWDGDKMFGRGDTTVTFATDGTVHIAKPDWENNYTFDDREELEAFIKLAQTMPFPVDDVPR